MLWMCIYNMIRSYRSIGYLEDLISSWLVLQTASLARQELLNHISSLSEKQERVRAIAFYLLSRRATWKLNIKVQGDGFRRVAQTCTCLCFMFVLLLSLRCSSKLRLVHGKERLPKPTGETGTSSRFPPRVL